MKSVVLKSANRVSQTLEDTIISCKFAICFTIVTDDDFLSKFSNLSDYAKEITILISNYCSLEGEGEFRQNSNNEFINKLLENRYSIQQRSRIQEALINLNERILGCPNELQHLIEYFSQKEKVLELLSSHKIIFQFLEEIKIFYMKILSLTLVEKETIERDFKLAKERINILKKEKESTLNLFNAQQSNQKTETIELEEHLLKLQSNLKTARENEKVGKEEIDKSVEKKKQENEKINLKTMQELSDRKNNLEVKSKEVIEKNNVLETTLQQEKEDFTLQYANLIKMHNRLKEEKRSNIDKELTWTNVENLEFGVLRANFDLVDENIKIGFNEEEKLKRIKEMELEALKILESSVVRIQKLFRGIRDRALVTKLKQKKKSKKKKKGKKKGKI